MSRFHGLSAGKIWQPETTGALPRGFGGTKGGPVTLIEGPVLQLLPSFDSRTRRVASAQAITSHFPGASPGGIRPLVDPREVLRPLMALIFRLAIRKSSADFCPSTER